jgi:hypothetical protein
MKLLGKMVALGLLVTAVSPVVLAYRTAQAPPQKPAGCHEHGQRSPAPNPVTYKCCQLGHQSAAVREAVELRSPVVQWFRGVELGAAPLLVLGCQSRPNSSGTGSPGITSLRI